MSSVGNLISVEDAIRIIDAVPLVPCAIEVSLADAHGLVLAEDLSADRDYPPFDKSLMDGFAVRCADVAQTPAELKVVGEVTAGSLHTPAISAGQTVAIMTGAPLPPGADGVVPVEDVENPGAQAGQMLRVLRAESPQRYLAKAGHEVRRGQLVLKKGARLDAPQLAVAATIGAAKVRVYSSPRVAVLSTGNEIVPFDQPSAPTQIRGCNAIMLCALLRRLGCRPVDMGIVADRREMVRTALAAAMQLDAVLVSGGMSAGRHDHVPSVLNELGVDTKIAKLRIKPGKPFVFGTIDRAVLAQRAAQAGSVPVPSDAGGTCYVFGLPGNPVSGFVCTLLLASRLLVRLGGSEPVVRWQPALLATGVAANGDREFYQPVRLEYSSRGLEAHPLEWKGSGDVFALAAADGLMRRPIGDPPRAAGENVMVMSLDSH